jgi:hypothetical protein
LHVGGHLVDQGVLLFGKWHPFVSFGGYGGKETIGVLKTWKDPRMRSFLCSITLVGLRLMSILYIGVSLYTASVLRGTLRFFYKIDFLPIKKKKNLRKVVVHTKKATIVRALTR